MPTSDALPRRLAVAVLHPGIATPATLRKRGLRVLPLPFRRALIYTPTNHWSRHL